MERGGAFWVQDARGWDLAEGRQEQMAITPRYRLGEAPTAVVQQLQAAARAHGHAAWATRWQCTQCERVSRWHDLVAGQVEHTDVWLPMCPTATCRGIGWLAFHADAADGAKDGEQG